MSWPRKPYVDRVQPYVPGRPIEEVERELGLTRLIKLASNENPLGPSPKAQKALARYVSKAHFYPESAGPLLTKALASRLGVKTSEIILGNGSNEIIEFLCRSLVGPRDQVLSSEKTFLVYPLITQICGGTYVGVSMNGMRYDLTRMLARVNRRTRIVFIANPNNPTGTYVSKSALDAFIKKVPGNVIVCIDEAYFDFADAPDFPNGIQYVKKGFKNVLVLRTFSKSYGLAGLRIGFGVGPESLIRYIGKVRQPFNTNAFAQTAALAALGDRAFLERTKKLAREGKVYLYRAFRKLRLSYVPSQANFVLVNLGQSAGPVVEALLRKGLIVRGMNAYNLPSHIRVTVGLPKENERFVKALEDVLPGCGLGRSSVPAFPSRRRGRSSKTSVRRRKKSGKSRMFTRENVIT